MDLDFVGQVRCTIFLLNRDLKVYLDLYVADFTKCTSQFPFGLNIKKIQNKYMFTFLVRTIQVLAMS